MKPSIQTAPAADGHAASDTVCVWHYPLDADTTGDAALLDAQERARAARFRFELHRRRFVTGRVALRRILAQHLDCDPGSLRFGYGPYGKPSLIHPAAGAALSFSASNSGALGAVAVARGGELGLDIEALRTHDDLELIARDAFAAEERAWLAALPPAEQTAGFYALWTGKEAYLKGKGIGLSAALDDFALALDAQWQPYLLRSALDRDDPQHWRLRRIDLLPGYSACLAEHGGARALRVRPWPLPPSGGSAAMDERSA